MILYALTYLEKGKYFALVMGDIYKNSQVIPLGFYTMSAIQNTFKVKLKGIVIKNIEGNKGKIGSQGIWRYRALKNEYKSFPLICIEHYVKNNDIIFERIDY